MNYRPCILLGNGLRNNSELLPVIFSLNIPILTTWMAADMIAEDHPAFCGRPGIFGHRAANIIQQQASHIYCIGARMDGEQVAYAYERFAPLAEERMVFDWDKAELDKFDDRWKKIHVNLDRVKKLDIPPGDAEYMAECRALYDKYRPELDGCDGGKFVDPFTFTRLLSEYSTPDDVFAIGSSGNAPTVFFQSFRVKAGQRISNVCTIGAMGADIPMALGAAMATGRRVICVTGDGGFQLNTQELETIRREKLNIIFFVMNNNGYNSIRVAQMARQGRKFGADPQSGLTLPDLENIAYGYRVAYLKLSGANLFEFHKCFSYAPIIVEVMVDPAWVQLPRVMASTVDGQLRTDNMEDMTPKP